MLRFSNLIILCFLCTPLAKAEVRPPCLGKAISWVAPPAPHQIISLQDRRLFVLQNVIQGFASEIQTALVRRQDLTKKNLAVFERQLFKERNRAHPDPTLIANLENEKDLTRIEDEVETLKQLENYVLLNQAWSKSSADPRSLPPEVQEVTLNEIARRKRQLQQELGRFPAEQLPDIKKELEHQQSQDTDSIRERIKSRFSF